MIEANHVNLRSDKATAPLTAWLISAAKAGDLITYGIAKNRLMQYCEFGKINIRLMGMVAGTAMDNILKEEQSAPLLNVLPVRKDSQLPGNGVAGYLAARYPGEKWLKKSRPSEKDPEGWKGIVDIAAREVYAYPDWDALYQRIYGSCLPKTTHVHAVEKDGLRYDRKGEGENHKALRLWVKENPQEINPRFRKVRAETEYSLLSRDRVDVVYFSKKEILAIDVKSIDSNPEDIRRGIYQCVKYRAVLDAMPIGRGRHRPVESWLVTESDIDKALKAEASKLNVKWWQAPSKEQRRRMRS